LFSRVICGTLVLSCLGGCSAGEKEPKEDEKKLPDLKGKKVVLIAAHRNYRDEELEKPRKILEKAKADVRIASSRKGKITGMLKGTAEAQLEVKDLDVGDFDALIFVGGSGAREFWEDEKCHALAKKALEGRKVLGAICIAPVTLARAGVLKDRKATVYKGFEDDLKKGGARVVKEDVVTDGMIVTANGPDAAEKFGRKVTELLVREQAPKARPDRNREPEPPPKDRSESRE
jgi:protease I